VLRKALNLNPKKDGEDEEDEEDQVETKGPTTDTPTDAPTAGKE
jgi:hypothetical protein